MLAHRPPSMPALQGRLIWQLICSAEPWAGHPSLQIGRAGRPGGAHRAANNVLESGNAAARRPAAQVRHVCWFGWYGCGRVGGISGCFRPAVEPDHCSHSLDVALTCCVARAHAAGRRRHRPRRRPRLRWRLHWRLHLHRLSPPSLANSSQMTGRGAGGCLGWAAPRLAAGAAA